MALAKDIVLRINDFNAPDIVENVDAWTHIILDLLFMEPGTYSDTPDLGINLKALTYIEADKISTYVKNELQAQVEKYLSNIPLDSVSVVTQNTENDDTVLLISLSFSTRYGEVSKSAFVSLNDELIDFIVDKFDNNG